MHCLNHPETDAQSFCQHCGKPLCAECIRKTASGQIFCENCYAATNGGTTVPGQAAPGANPGSSSGGSAMPNPGAPNPGLPNPGQIPPFYPIPQMGPNPSAAAVLGLIPGVGAMYNGQLFKGLIHILVFAVLVSLADHHGIFGLMVAGWVLYQSFEAFHTAKARRDGLPVPDPFGLNEVGNWLNLGGSWGGSAWANQNRAGGVPPVPPGPVPPGGVPPGQAPGAQSTGGFGQQPPPYSAPYTNPYPSSWAGQSTGPVPPQPGYSESYTGAAANPGPYPGSYSGLNPDPFGEPYAPGAIPPIPPVPPVPPPPVNWKRREPVFAFVLIGLGILFLLQSMGFVGHVMHYIWPLMLIGVGAWLVIRRVGPFQGGSK